MKKILCVSGICGIIAIGLYLHIPLSKDVFSNNAATSLKITDRHGIVLRETLSAEGGRKTWLTYKEIPESVIQAVISAEDKRFFSHSGVDFLALGRALVQNLRAGRVVSGASTITQQLVKNRFDYSRSFLGKLKEMIIAIRLEKTFSKQEILTQYLNRVGFSNQTFGIEAAARLYFQKPARHLSLAESVFLSGLIQAPSRLNPYRHFEKAVQRQRYLLERMYRNNLIDEASYRIARQEELRLTPKKVNFKAPHFCELILKGKNTPLPPPQGGSEPTPGPSHAGSGLVGNVETPGIIRTTLDYYLQEKVEEIIVTRIDELEDYNVTNAAVVVLDNRNGDVLAYVGSKDFFDDTISGQVNGVLALRQPGSTLKPFTYQLALERSYTPATLIPDIKDYPAEPRSFLPENYDRKFHGPVRLRQALACSYNIPAVRVLDEVGVEALYDRLHAFGFESLRDLPSFYGPGLTLGNGEVTLLELTRAYSILARRGKGIQERYILEMKDLNNLSSFQFPVSSFQFLFSTRVIYLITHILADRQAAVPAFGEDTPLELPFPTAVKTGTSKDYRDNWTVGYTSDYTVGVWVGNFDGAPMQRVSGITGAAPIYRDIMLYLYRHHDPPSLFANPPVGIVSARICPLSGKLAGNDCPHSIEELFLEGTVPTEFCQMHQAYWVDSRDELLTDPTSVNAVKKVFIHFPPLYQAWAREMGYPFPPDRYSPLEKDKMGGDSPPGRGQGWVHFPFKEPILSLSKEGQRDVHFPFEGGQRDVHSPFEGGQGDVSPLIEIVHPNDGDVYAVDPVLRREYQTLQLSAVVPPEIERLIWYVDDEQWESVEAPFQAAWTISPGTHRIYAEAHHDGEILRTREITVYIVE
jgi:penicillin-binding protein 1C